MKPDSPQKFEILRRLAGTAAMIVFSASAWSQQTVVPGATALETEEEEVRRYSVELIIFEYVDRSSAGTEIFDPDLPPEPLEEDPYYGDAPLELPIITDPLGPDQADSGEILFEDDTDVLMPIVIDEDIALELIPTYEQAGLKLLGPEDYVLNAEYERLETLGAYRPLMRAAWTQPTIEKDLTMPITLRRIGDPPLRLDGTVTLYLSRFLHLVVDLALEERAPLRVPPADSRLRRFGDERARFRFDPEFITPSIFYRIQEDRIVRNGELRYYDHPRFGVLAKITRIEEDQPRDGNADSDLFGTPISGQN